MYQQQCVPQGAVVRAAADCRVGIVCPNAPVSVWHRTPQRSITSPNAAAVVRAAVDRRVGIVCPNAPVSVWHRVPKRIITSPNAAAVVRAAAD